MGPSSAGLDQAIQQVSGASARPLGGQRNAAPTDPAPTGRAQSRPRTIQIDASLAALDADFVLATGGPASLRQHLHH